MLINSHPSTEALSKILNHEETPPTIKNIATSALKQSPDGKEVLARQDTGIPHSVIGNTSTVGIEADPVRKEHYR